MIFKLFSFHFNTSSFETTDFSFFVVYVFFDPRWIPVLHFRRVNNTETAATGKTFNSRPRETKAVAILNFGLESSSTIGLRSVE